MPRPVHPDGKVHGVVAAIRRDDGRYLCIRRSADVPAPLKVCFPGGAVELGESHKQALIREIHEELGIDIAPLPQCWQWLSPDQHLHLHGFAATWIGGTLRLDPKEIQEVLWLTPDELLAHPDALPTNRDFLVSLGGPPSP